MAHEEVHKADERLLESREIRQRAKRVGDNLNGHKRRNRFGEMLDREVFGGDDEC